MKYFPQDGLVRMYLDKDGLPCIGKIKSTGHSLIVFVWMCLEIICIMGVL